MEIETIHHYTSVDTLALILESRKIRFNRADRVDNIREAQTHNGIEFGKYFFLSCWTHDSKESIPQWHMYTHRMTGVRISLPTYPFQRKRLEPRPEWNMQSQGELFCPLSLEEQLGKGYFVVPMCMALKAFAGPVDYVNDVEDRYARAVSVIKQENNVCSISVSEPYNLVRLKTPEWEFQKEYRFFLFALPSIPLPADGPGSPDFYMRLPDHMLESMLRGIGPGVNHIDVDLSESALEKLVVTVGPLCPPGAKACVRALVDRYAPKARIDQSCFANTIRDPVR